MINNLPIDRENNTQSLNPESRTMASSPENTGTVTLRSSDGAIFEVEESVALQMTTIKNMIDEGWAEGGISLPKVAGGTLAKVVNYCKRHAECWD